MAAVGVSLSSARAQTYTWGGTGSTTTTGTYNLGTEWSTTFAGAPPVSTGKAAVFSSTGNTNVTVTGGPTTPDSWTFDATSKSFVISGAAVSFSGGGPNLVNNANAGQIISISNDLTGAGLSQAGSSLLSLSGTNSFTATSVTGGTLNNTGNLATTLTNSATFRNFGGVLTGSISNTGAFNNVLGTVTGALSQSAGTTSSSGSINGGVTLMGGSFTTTGTVLNGINSISTTVNAAGTINGGIVNLVSSVFTVTGSLSANGFFANSGSAQVAISGGDLTGVTAFTNNSIVTVSAARTLSATSVANNFGTFTNNGTVTTTGGTSNASNATFANSGTLNGGLNNSGTASNSGTINGGVTNSSTFSTTGTTNGGLTNSANVNAAGTINGNITNQAGGNFTVTGNLIANGNVTAGNQAYFTVSGGNITGISTLTNNASGMIYFTGIDAGRTLSAANVVNNGNLSVAGTLNATNSFSNAIGGNIRVESTGTINGSIDAAGGYIQVFGGINGNLTLSGDLAAVNTQGGSVSGRVTLAAAGSQAYSTAGGATYGSLAGVAGSQVDVSGFNLTVGGDNTDSWFAGSLVGAGGFAKIGGGTLWLSGDSSTYIGTTTVNGGQLLVTGSLASSAVTVNNGGTLFGSGIVGATQVNAGSAFAPGIVTPGTSMTLPSLSMQSGAAYLVFLDPTNSTFANVTGNAALGGATVGASFATGGYVAKRYTILNAGGITGVFDPTVLSLGLPSGFKTALSYDATHAYLDLSLNFIPPPRPGFVGPPGSGLSGNQQKVGTTIVNFFNTNGTIPMVFGGLTPAGLSQLSGEGATAPQQTTFQAMGQFMGVMTDPFVAGRGDGLSAGGVPNAFAEEGAEQGLAYAARSARSKSERAAYAAVYTKAPPAAPRFEQRWSVWAAGFGGSQQTDGNTATGSGNTTSSLYGTAVGADYRISRDTLVGFALAGGGTNFTVANNLGGGRSDLFQVGAFFRHNVGPAYITGALAYGWQDVVTDRTLTVAGIDRLRAEFNANAYSGRLEGGYRFVSQGFGWTPYAAAQFTTFDLPAYAEQVIVGSNNFALAYNSKSVTDTRAELGLRSDKAFAEGDGIITLRGRLAWAHDFNPDRAIGATFQTLPGASFVVNGAAMATDSALVTGSVEKRWLTGWSAAATFEGEFSNVTRSYAGKGLVRYAW